MCIIGKEEEAMSAILSSATPTGSECTQRISSNKCLLVLPPAGSLQQAVNALLERRLRN